MTKLSLPIQFAGSQLEHARHVCAFFNSEEEEYRVLLPFIADGFACGHRSIHLVSQNRFARHIQHLKTLGIDVEEAQRTGQLELRLNTEAYLRNGQFDQERMLQLFENMSDGRRGGAYPLSRIVCQMEWASRQPCCIHELLEFEARANEIWSQRDDVVICAYDLAKFSGDVVMDVMRTHPMIIVGGILQQNPFFVPPGEFLRELQQRRAARAQALCSAG